MTRVFLFETKLRWIKNDRSSSFSKITLTSSPASAYLKRGEINHRTALIHRFVDWNRYPRPATELTTGAQFRHRAAMDP
jgi:hypothetical protein